MSYNIRNSAGQVVVNVPDRHTDKESTSLALVGYNVTNYGLDHSENFYHLLENFAFDSPPQAPVMGQLWYDTASDTMMLYSGTEWNPVGGGGGPSVGGNPFENGLSGSYHLAITDPATSVLLFFAGGKIVMILSPIDLLQSSLPANVEIQSVQYPVASRFPYGLQAGATMAQDADDYVFMGKVPQATQALFAGGGDANKPAGWSFIDLGTNSVALMISNGVIICAVSQIAVPNASLVTSVAVTVQLDDHTFQTTTMPFKSIFPGGLVQGLTFSTGFAVGGTVTLALFQQGLDDQYALITEEYKVWVDANSATASKMLLLETKFTSAAGNSSFAQAIDYILAQSTDTSATATAITALKTEFQTALGTTTWADALSKLSTTSTATTANSTDLTQLKAALQTNTGFNTFAEAINKLWVEATTDAGGTVAGWSLTLNSNGYITGIQALNGGATNNFFKVTASQFIIGDNNIDFIPFEVRNGVVYMKNAVIENLSIGTEKITGNAISTMAYTFLGGDYAIPTNGGGGDSVNFSTTRGRAAFVPAYDIMNIGFNKTSNDSTLEIVCYMNAASENDFRLAVTIFRDGVQLQQSYSVMISDGGQPSASCMTFVALDGVGAGGHTYTVRVQNLSYDGSSTLYVLSTSYVKVTEFKK